MAKIGLEKAKDYKGLKIVFLDPKISAYRVKKWQNWGVPLGALCELVSAKEFLKKGSLKR